MRRISEAACAALVAALVLGCAQSDEDADNSAETGAVAGELAEPATTNPALEQPTSSSRGPLTVSDLDAYVRGVRAEIDVVEKARARLRAAKTGTDTLSAIFATIPDNTQPDGASSAGVSLDRYRVITDQVDRTLAGRDMAGAMAKQKAQMDTTGLDSAMRARVRESLAEMDAAWGDPYKDLPADVADAFKRRVPELDSLRVRLATLRIGGAATP